MCNPSQSCRINMKLYGLPQKQCSEKVNSCIQC
jgi:hypothetical protein